MILMSARMAEAGIGWRINDGSQCPIYRVPGQLVLSVYTTESERKTIANFRQWCRSVGIERSLVNNVRLFKCQKATHQSRIATIYREQTAIFNKVFLCI